MDSEFWWRLDLSSPLVDIRRMAAVQMLLDPPPASAGEELAAFAAREEDAETRAMLQQVVAGYKKLPAAVPAESDGPWAGWSGSPAQRLEWLGRLPAEKRRELAGHAPEQLRRERHPLVASALIRIFGRAWPEAHLEELVRYASDDNAAVCLGALEALRQRKSELLLPVLPALLTSPHFRIRGAAVRALAEVDPDEALAHLEALLLDSDPSRRLEGLRCCLHARFDKVMPLLLKAMAIETDVRRLIAYGTLFEINPALEAPFRLYELSERASHDRAEVFRALVASACRVIGNTLLKPEEFQKYRAQLQTWIDRRAAAGLAQDIVARAADGRGIDHELIAMVERARKRSGLWNAFQTLATLPMPPAARALFQKLIGESPVAPEEKASANGAPGEAAVPGATVAATDTPPSSGVPVAAERTGEDQRKTPPDRLEVLALLTPADRDAARREIMSILSTIEKSPAPLVAAALRAAIRCLVDDQAPAARRVLKASDPGVVSAAIEYLGRFAPDDIEPLLGRFLASAESRIKTAAVRVLQRSDPLQAVSALKAMLRSRQFEQQKLGVACLVHVEFALVRDALVELFETNPPAELLDTGLCLFQMNADPEGVFLLYLLEKQVPKDAAERVRKTRREMMAFLAASGRMATDPDAVENDLKKRAEDDTKKRIAVPPAYAYKVLHKTIASSDLSAKNETPDLFSEASRRTILVAAVALALISLIAVAWNGLAGRGGETASASISGAALPVPTGRLQIRQVEGWVREARSPLDEFKIEAETGEFFRVPCRDYEPPPARDARFKGALILMRKNDDGTWFARRAAAAGLR